MGLTWGDECEDNVLFNYRRFVGQNHVGLTLSFMTALVAAWACFPLNAFPCKFAIVAMVNFQWPTSEGNVWVGRLVGTVLVVLSFICAVGLPSLKVVNELIGATAGVAVMFIIPPSFYI